ncbi:ankyrin repeats (many copies) domain-containing protein [Hirsutella rhossiliensis]|uniref:Transcription factor SWI6 n=1 Tax=Hirsutella rhossiliensis TaxID=111463 RepID=A0A9P8MVV4_9HYPO|nr:ankyrin repeats (many copies) domain-containing protein [Hirsutella rhossiliensis]KAH0961987.1 ankyrin repeats (many copies) domain-containing protein [Hirsutella rhossiliensis]
MSQQSQPRHAASFHHDYKIYSALYSGVDVYEMEVNNVAVMRRRQDSWLNATQVLKVAGVDKGKRTKILEKEIQTGEHEKVQGGYGKYQGTWIKFDRGVELCRQYGVEELLRPLLTYDMGQDGGIAGRGDFNTPTKEQAMAAQRKRMYNSSVDGRPNGLSGTFFKNISSTASHAVAAISKARFDSPGPRSRNGPSRAPSFSRQPSMQNGDDFPANSQQSYASDYGQQVDSAYSTQQQGAGAAAMPDNEPPRKRQRVTMTPADSFGGYSQSMDMYAPAFPGSPTEPNESFIYTQGASVNPHSPGEDPNGPLPPLPYEMSSDVETKRSMLMGLFMDSTASDVSKHDMLRTLAPAELDMPIDPQSHTALHWAATLARMPLLRALIAAGASPYRVNASGETALMRACLVTNSMDHGSFPDLLEVLGGTIEARDHKGRTVLHHIAVTSAVKGRNAASRYYLESLLEWVVRSQSAIPKMGIARFMSEIVNAQDGSGDTALNIAARIGNRSIISQLLEVGADPNIANRVGLRPVDFGIGGENAEDEINGDAIVETNGTSGSSQRTRESGEEIIASITHLLNETGAAFQQEMKSKQVSLDSLHATLRTTSTQLGEARRTLDHLTANLKKQQLARQKISNLAHAREDEQVSLMNEQSRSSQPNPSTTWETELSAMLEAAEESSAAPGGGYRSEGMLPSGAVLRARIRAIEGRRDVTRKMVQALKGRSRDVEIKYRHVVALCTGVQESEVDAVVDGLLKAVESERDELDIGRVRRFLGGVEGVVH